MPTDRNGTKIERDKCFGNHCKSHATSSLCHRSTNGRFAMRRVQECTRRNIHPLKTLRNLPTSPFTTFTKLLFLQRDDSVNFHVRPTPKRYRFMSRESPDVQSASRPQGQEITHATPGSGPSVEVTGERMDTTRTKYLIHSAKSQIKTQVCPVLYPWHPCDRLSRRP